MLTRKVITFVPKYSPGKMSAFQLNYNIGIDPSEQKHVDCCVGNTITINMFKMEAFYHVE